MINTVKKSQGNYSGKYFQFHRIRENVKEEEIKSQISQSFWNQQIKPNILTTFRMESKEIVKRIEIIEVGVGWWGLLL